jgi:phosphoglycolate/pyridoxal phosphate phosphatase family enzyme
MASGSVRPPLRLLILDLDGVVYRGTRPVEGAPELVAQLHVARVAVRYATNNSMSTRAAFASRLAAMGIPATPDEIVTSVSATIEYLQRHEPQVRSVLTVGASGMVEELRGAGFEVHPAADLAGMVPASQVNAVLVGVDFDFDEARLAAAAAAIRSGARFVATNADARYPTPDGFRPGAGAMVDAVRAASGVSPLVIGKPEPAMFEAILEQTGAVASEAIVVGDSLDSDILGARRAGIESIVVLTGVTSASAAAEAPPDRTPDHVAEGPGDIWTIVQKRIRR